MILKYISSRGREFSFMSSGLKVMESNFHSSGWTPEGREIEYGLRVSRFKREPVTYQAQLVLMGTQEENFTLLDAFHDARVFDIRNRRPGKVYWNSYYAECYITSIDPQPDEFRQKVNIEVYCPYPFWIKEEVVKFYDSASYMDSGFLDYEYDYNHDYKGRTAGEGRITNDTSVPCKIKIMIYGPATNPRISIAGQHYSVLCTLVEGEILTIDQVNGTVIRETGELGNRKKINEFNNRSKEESIFTPVPIGQSVVNWSGKFYFEITMYKERDEAKWKE